MGYATRMSHNGIEVVREYAEAHGRVLSTQLFVGAGITYRQLDYWCRAGILEFDGGSQTGDPRTFPRVEIDVARIIGQLSAHGISVTSALCMEAAKIARAGTGGTVSSGPIVVFVEPHTD